MAATGGSHFVGPDGTTHYQRNKQQYIDRIHARRQSNLAFIRTDKANKGCADCGIMDWRVLDHDHLPQYVKDTDVYKGAIRGWSIVRLLEEINKCDVVCANCHRIRTFERRNQGSSGGTEYTAE